MDKNIKGCKQARITYSLLSRGIETYYNIKIKGDSKKSLLPIKCKGRYK